MIQWLIAVKLCLKRWRVKNRDMFNTNILDVVIGLIFIYLLYSLLATTIQETISTILHRRANVLHDGIKSMLSDTKKDKGVFINFFRFILKDFPLDLIPWLKRVFTGTKTQTLYTLFYEHPIIKNYGQNLLFKKPSYLTAENFSSILIESLKKLDNGDFTAANDFDLIKQIVEKDQALCEKFSITLPKGTSVLLSAGTPVSLDLNTIVSLTKDTIVTNIETSFIKKSWKYFFAVARIFFKNNVPFEGSALLPAGTTLAFSAGTLLPLTAKTTVSFDTEVIGQHSNDSGVVKIDKDTRDILIYHINEAGGDLNVFKFRIERWFNDTMDRVSGWYKRNTQFYLLFLGLFLAIVLNIDTIQITNFLSTNRDARKQMADLGVAAASNQYYKTADENGLVKEARDSIKADISKVNTLVGLGWGDYGQKDKIFIQKLINDKPGAFAKSFSWVNDKEDFYNQISKIQSDSLIPNDLYNKYGFYLRRNYIYHRIDWKKFLGFIITALAISLGSTFWFDLLNKFVSLRTAVKTVDSSGSTTKNNTSDNNNADG
jgi:hypothetical protein